MSEITPNIGLKIPAAGGFTQASDIQDSFRILDAMVGTLSTESAISGTATGGSVTTIIDTSLNLGVNAFAGGVLVIFRNGVLLRADKVVSNTVDTLTFATGLAVVAGDTYTLSSQANAIPNSEKGVANGVATTNVDNEVVEQPTGAAAQVALGNASKVKRADGSWGFAGKVLQVAHHTWVAGTTTTSATHQPITGSGFSFTPISATSKLIIETHISMQLGASGTSSAGAEVRARSNSTYLASLGIGLDIHFYPQAGVSPQYYTQLCRVDILPVTGSTSTLNLDLTFRSYAPDASFATVNVGSNSSSITVTEVEV